jgi:CheY-like chemotaxis protein/HPt (histidine-containing phosphotransfer) domain-containing protein
MEADKLELEHNVFDLCQLFTQSIELLKHQADRKRLALTLIIDPNLPRYAKGDQCRLRQILINLINNAIKFTPSGSITVSALTTQQADGNFTLQCTVQDTGIGIAKELQASLFEEFTMADQTYSRKHEGTGLGLAICKRLTALMNGQICFNNNSEKGSTITFTAELEVIDQLETNHVNAHDEPEYVLDKNTRVLLAEDNQANQMVIKSILEYAGLQVDIVTNGCEAVDAVRHHPYDIVLMDISMPEMDGITATKKIRQLPGEASNIPIVAITAHALSGDRERFLEAGMDDYLIKPINRNATLNCIAHLTGSKIQEVQINSTEMLQVDTNSVDTNNKYIDEAMLQQLVIDTDIEIVPELLTLYIDDARRRVKMIDHAINKNDFKVLEFESHTLGSSAAAHGNEKLYKLARKIEHFCQSKKHKQAIENATTLLTVADKSFQLLAHRVAQGFNTKGFSNKRSNNTKLRPVITG